MRRFDAIWEYNGSTYTDRTLILSEGTSSVTLSAGESLYFGLSDWFSGVLAFLSTVPSPSPSYILEQYNGDDWQTLPLEESLMNLSTGVELQRGSLYWGQSPFAWERLVFSNTVPEAAAPPDAKARYWVRLRVVSGEISIDRILPQLFNTYATIEELENFIGYQFTDTTPPTRDTVRKMIRANEDWLDQFTRRSWRPRVSYNETHNFNPYGVKLKKYPVWFMMSVGLWNGSTFNAMTEGRGQEYFVDQGTGRLLFTIPSYRLRNYTFLLSRSLRQSFSLLVTYAYGEDFDTSPYTFDVKNIILKKTAADLINQNDWTGLFSSGMDNVPKPQKVASWIREATEAASELRMPLIV